MVIVSVGVLGQQYADKEHLIRNCEAIVTQTVMHIWN